MTGIELRAGRDHGLMPIPNEGVGGRLGSWPTDTGHTSRSS